MSTTPSARVFEVPTPIPARTRIGQRWMDTSLRVKLLAVVAMVVLATLPIFLMSLRLEIILIDAREETREAADRLDRLNELQDTTISAIAPVNYYAILGFDDPDYVEQYRANAGRVEAELPRLEAAVPAELDDRATRLSTAIDALFDELDTLASYRAGSPSPDEAAAAPQPPDLRASLLALTAARVDFNDAVFDLEQSLNDQLEAERDRVDDIQSELVLVTVIAMALGLAASVAAVLVVSSSVLRRVDVMSRNSERLLEGEPLAPVRQSADEIGRLSDRIAYAGALLEGRRRDAVAATRAKDDFLSRVSHELKTPLTAMIGFAQLLEEDPELSEESREDTRRIVNAGHHLHGLIQELLDIKAIESGKLAVTLEPVAVGDLADETVSLVRSMPAAQSLTIQADCPDGVVVAADRRRLREVLLNLLSNAVKYNRERGRVDLVAARIDGSVRIEVVDTGPGISAEDQELLFQPFERLGAGTTDVEGSGIGLALTKRVVEAMGGAIGVESEVGEGSTFWVELPASDAAPADGQGGDVAARDDDRPAGERRPPRQLR